MAVVSTPKLGVPYWTAYSPVDGDSSPVDPLRFETYAERLGNQLFPGITNRVERARYFGMVAAGIEAAAEGIGHLAGREQVQAVRARFIRFEAAWAFSVVASEDGQIKERREGAVRPSLKHELRGLRGANRVLGFWHAARDRSAIDARGGYKLLQAQEAQGGLGAYLVALREHGFVRPDRLELTSPGSQLASAFRGTAGRKRVRALTVDGKHDLATWRRAGEHFSPGWISEAEADLIRGAVFGEHRQLGRYLDRLPAELRTMGSARAAFAHIAAGDSDLAEMSRYALAFDDLRRAGLRMFALAGDELTARTGPQPIAGLLSAADASDLGGEAKAAATTLLSCATPRGLEPVGVLSAELVAAPPRDVLARLINFHHREGRHWITPVSGGRVQLGTPGAFQDPGDGFHGFTLNAAFSVYHDLEQAGR